jgi:hypothetical protein
LPDSDLLSIERLHHGIRSVNLRPVVTYAGLLPILAEICSMVYCGSSRLRKAQKPCANYRVHVQPLQVLEELGFERWVSNGEVIGSDTQPCW